MLAMKLVKLKVLQMLKNKKKYEWLKKMIFVGLMLLTNC